MMKIKMVDLLGQYSNIKPQIDEAIEDVLHSTAFIQGSQVAECANALGRYLQINSLVPMCQPTALQITIMALTETR